MRRKNFNPRPWTRGNANVEFALCAIFMVFLMISMADLGRGLWLQHTLTEAVRDGARFAIVRGTDYWDPVNNKRLDGGTLDDVRKAIKESAIGLVPAELDLTFHLSSCGAVCTDLIPPIGPCKADASDCGAEWGNPWPLPPFGSPPNEVTITAHYPYNSAVVMYFPGAKGMSFGRFILGSTARERIVF